MTKQTVANPTPTRKLEASWDDILDGTFPESPARTAWREAVAEVGDRAKATLPACNGRIEKAVQIVLAGDVELLDDGKARVASQSNGTARYFIVNGGCECPDVACAPQGFCKHRLAYGIAKRAHTLANNKLETLVGETPTDETPAPPALPEAPASANVYVEIAGRKVQITLRDQDEQHLLTRMTAILEQFPVTDETPAEDWCSIHQVNMTRSKDGKGYFHKAGEKPDGKAIWCRGK
jgi:hypothetical protein